MADLLFEIGCEELPPPYVASGERELAEAVAGRLDAAGIEHGAIERFATPRRLAVIVRAVSASQSSKVSERRGPPVQQSIAEDGSFTAAAEGFARSAGVAVETLVRRRTDGGEYLFAVIERASVPVREVLPGLLSDAMRSLAFDKTMRWDASGARFPRPVRWLVALLDGDVLPARFGALTAGRASMGHRVVHPGPVDIADPSAYAGALLEAGVVADRAHRRMEVVTAAVQVGAGLGGAALVHDAIVDEVTDLVERPLALAGRFDEAYLKIPRSVLLTAMEKQQRYIGVENREGGLVAGFVCVTNGAGDSAVSIVAGNERVLRARLEDARFFWEQDLAATLSARAERLGEVVFHPALGTMRDKAARLELLVPQVGEWIGIDPDARAAAQLAARVCKADLLTQMVYEFPELQGAMGGEYARRDASLAAEAGDRLGAVAAAISEHYLPRGADDTLPVSDAGVALALADRIDTLVGYLGIGVAPTGSGDPFALRRQASGIVQIVFDRPAKLPVRAAVEAAWTLYTQQGRALGPLAGCAAGVTALLVARVEAILASERIGQLLVKAAVGGPWTDLIDLADRARLLQRLQDGGSLHRLAVAHERAFNLTRNAEGTDIDATVLDHIAERELHSTLEEVEHAARERARNGDLGGALDALEPLGTALDGFLSPERGVRVMDDDERVRRNRLALLARAAALFGLVADFSVLIPKELEGTAEADAPPED